MPGQMLAFVSHVYRLLWLVHSLKNTCWHYLKLCCNWEHEGSYKGMTKCSWRSNFIMTGAAHYYKDRPISSHSEGFKFQEHLISAARLNSEWQGPSYAERAVKTQRKEHEEACSRMRAGVKQSLQLWLAPKEMKDVLLLWIRIKGLWVFSIPSGSRAAASASCSSCPCSSSFSPSS